MNPADVLVFDLETTSADAKTARIVQIAMTTLQGEKVYDQLVNPGCPIQAGATKVHGITDEKVSGAPSFSEFAQGVTELIAGKVLAGYSSRRFDVPVLDRELRAAGEPGIDLCTVVEIDALRAWTELRPRTLVGALKEWCGEEFPDAHDALADCRATAKVIKAMAFRAVDCPDCREDDQPGDGEDCDALAKLVALSKPSYEVDRDGGYKLDDGRVVFGNGARKGEPVADHLYIVRYRCEKDDSEPDQDLLEALANEANERGSDMEAALSRWGAEDASSWIEASRPPWHVDDAGCFKLDDDGKVVFGKGKHKGEYAYHHADYLGWIAHKSNYPEETQKHAQRFLDLLDGHLAAPKSKGATE